MKTTVLMSVETRFDVSCAVKMTYFDACVMETITVLMSVETWNQ